jgi:hypothetical protein
MINYNVNKESTVSSAVITAVTDTDVTSRCQPRGPGGHGGDSDDCPASHDGRLLEMNDSDKC